MATPAHPPSPPLLAWYDRHARDLPWRQDAGDPYRIWVSEIMLQQTRVDTVLRYYLRFLTAFPDVASLARADDDTLLVQWEGLGYYRRARLLRNGARVVTQDWLNGEPRRWPRTADEWRTIPGVGRYTAAAIASIVFGERVAVVDGNVKRVLARLFTVEDEVDGAAGERRIWELAASVLSAERPGDHNQALMELGATVCTPRSPRCGDCPLNEQCAGLAAGRVAELPRRLAKKPVPHRREAVAVVRRDADKAILLRRRPNEGMLGGMWELPAVTLHEGERPLDALRERLTLAGGDEVEAGADNPRIGSVVATARHAYSHFTIDCTAHEVNPTDPLPDPLPPGWLWMVPSTRSRIAVHRAHDKLLAQLYGRQRTLPLPPPEDGTG